MLKKNLKLTVIDTNKFGGLNSKALWDQSFRFRFVSGAANFYFKTKFKKEFLNFEILYTPTILTSETSGDVMLMDRFYTLV